MINQEDLNNRCYAICIDMSGSMGDPVKSGSKQSKWEACKEYTMSFVRACDKLDDDGIDVYFFNKSFKKFNHTTSDIVLNLFQRLSPNGGTDFVPFLSDAITEFQKEQNKPWTIIVVTDGEPSESDGQQSLTNLIVKTTKKLEGQNELAIRFIQVGNDMGAMKFLKGLQNDLTNKGAKFDIVSTVTCDELDNKSIEEVLLSSLS